MTFKELTWYEFVAEAGIGLIACRAVASVAIFGILTRSNEAGVADTGIGGGRAGGIVDTGWTAAVSSASISDE